MTKATPPTLQDVANLVGVSTATISRALNAPDKVAVETREKIQSAIDKTGYTPNFGGRMLASAKTGTVGALIPTMSNAIFANGIQAFQERLAQSGVTLLIASTGYDPAEELAQIRSLMAHGAGGLLLIGDERPEETRTFLRLRGLPHVIGWTHRDDPFQVYVGFDNHLAAREMAQKVMAAGHRRIAMITGVLAGNDRARDRLDGTRDAISNVSGAALVALEEAPYFLADGSAAFRRIRDSGTHPTAIICGNDVLAAGAMIAAREAGISVPEDLSIVGFDDIGLAAAVHPPMTTMRVPQFDMGRLAADKLLAMINGDTDVQGVRLDTELIMRGTLAAPPTRDQ